jgi:hypothetical protein
MRGAPAIISTGWTPQRRNDAASTLLALRLANLASGTAPLVADALLQQLRRTSPLVRTLVPPTTATVRRMLRREVLRAIDEYEEERRRVRRRRVRLSLALGALAAAVAGGSSRMRGA